MAITTHDYYRRISQAPSLVRRAGNIMEGLVLRLRQYRRHRLDRAAFLNLRNLEDWALRDIGYTREDVEWASRLPLHVNAAQALRARVRNRRTQRPTSRP